MAGRDSGQSERPASGPRAGEMTSALLSVAGGILYRVAFNVGDVGEITLCISLQASIYLLYIYVVYLLYPQS